MKVKGRKTADWSKFVSSLTGPKWYELLNLKEVAPHMGLMTDVKGRAQRVEFSALESVVELVNMIREANPTKFRTNAQVHRCAHYWGVYIMRELFLTDKIDLSKNPSIAAHDTMEGVLNDGMTAEKLKTFVQKIAENYHSGLMTLDECKEKVNDLGAMLGDKFLPILEQLVEMEIGNKDAREKILTRIRVRKYRAKKRLEAITGEVRNIEDYRAN